MSPEGIVLSLSLLLIILFVFMCTMCGLLQCPTSYYERRNMQFTQQFKGTNKETKSQDEPPPPYPGYLDHGLEGRYQVEEDPPPPYPGIITPEAQN